MCICKLSRRSVLRIAAFGLIATATIQRVPSAWGQAFLCSYAGNIGLGRLAPATPVAWQDVQRAMSVIGLRIPIQVFQGQTGNALALVMPDQFGTPIPTIVYNPNFLNQLYQLGGRYASMSVLAHEVGHHANRDSSWMGQFKHPWQRELGADFVSGLVLGRIGASLDEATRALRAMFSLFGDPGHPDTRRRLNAVTDGWLAGGGRGQFRL